MIEKCFACDRKLPKAGNHVVTCIDGQTVWVGPECAKLVKSAGRSGYQPPKGGPKLYTLFLPLSPKVMIVVPAVIALSMIVFPPVIW